MSLIFSSRLSLGTPSDDVIKAMKSMFDDCFGPRENLIVEDTGNDWFRCVDYASGSDYVVAYYKPDKRCKFGKRLELVVGRPRKGPHMWPQDR